MEQLAAGVELLSSVTWAKEPSPIPILQPSGGRLGSEEVLSTWKLTILACAVTHDARSTQVLLAFMGGGFALSKQLGWRDKCLSGPRAGLGPRASLLYARVPCEGL